MSGQIVDYGNYGTPIEGAIVSDGSYTMEGAVATETILESGEAVQASPSDSTITSDVVTPDTVEEAPAEEN